MTGRDLIALASQLAASSASGNAEARCRSAISRAYYGAFHIASAFLAECQSPVPENATGHESAYRRLFQTNIAPAIEAARYLNDLRRERINADYRLTIQGMDSMENAKDKVEMAETVRVRLDECRTEPYKSQVVAALKSQTA